MNTSWLTIDPDSDFSIHNLPYGIFSVNGEAPRVGVAVGEWVMDLPALGRFGFFRGMGFHEGVFSTPTLNAFIGLGPATWHQVRAALQRLLAAEHQQSWAPYWPQFTHPRTQVTMHLPVKIGNYTDFYASEYHATNVGRLFRPDQPLMPNWKHLPVAYHGRASSIVVSGTDLHRPCGQLLPAGHDAPVFGPSQALDYELEIGAIVGKNTPLGQAVSTAEAADCLFGFVLFNDWSARDLQRWEYQPLGPFLGKNFGSSISPWVVPLEALRPFATAAPVQEPAVLPYLQRHEDFHFDVTLESFLTPAGSPTETRLSRSNWKYLYWDFAQMLAHHTVNGCNLCIGDVLASGTISGPEAGALGCLLEQTQGGRAPVQLPENQQRGYLQDGDCLTLRGHAQGPGYRVGFGQVTGRVLPARSH